jgi:hypothetical protein
VVYLDDYYCNWCYCNLHNQICYLCILKLMFSNYWYDVNAIVQLLNGNLAKMKIIGFLLSMLSSDFGLGLFFWNTVIGNGVIYWYLEGFKVLEVDFCMHFEEFWFWNMHQVYLSFNSITN